MDLSEMALLMKMWPLFVGFITLVIKRQKVIDKIYYKIFEIIMLGLLFILFGLYVVYLFAEWIILSVVDVFRSICRR
jgi:hypothetical protein